MLMSFFQKIIDLLAWLLNIILFVLPESPFQALESFGINSEYLAAANYFLPIREIIATCEAWLVAITVYYLWMVIGRWVKVID